MSQYERGLLRMQNVAIFWDLDNTYYTQNYYYGGGTQSLIQLLDLIWKRYENTTVRLFRAYADFEKIRGLQTDIQKKRVTPKHVFSSNNNSENRKNAGDIELSLDALETALKNPEIDKYVIVSADRDMIPLINRLRFYGKTVDFIYLEAAISDDRLILDFPNSSESIEKMMGLTVFNKGHVFASTDLSPNVSFAIKVVTEFYTRNKGKTTMFVGKSIFVDDITRLTKISGLMAEALLDYCVKHQHLTETIHQSTKKTQYILPPQSNE